jgi:hypothetical protein
MKLGGSDIVNVQLGSAQVNKVYQGANLVWEYIPPTPLLDDYPSAAAAYSLRKLRSAYTGSAIEVRRTNNDVADIGFTSSGTLDTAALLAFTGTGALDNGFVTKWYDQSGNAKDATQTTLANQPQIVSSGSVILDNGKPTILFDGVNDVLLRNIFGFPTTNISISKVGSRIGSAAHDSIGYNTNGGFININGDTRIGFDGRPSGGVYTSSTATTTGTTDQILQINIYDGSNMKASVDGGTFATTAITVNPIVYANQILNIGAITTIASWYNCNVSELIIWGSDETSNKIGIETNINSHYNIY